MVELAYGDENETYSTLAPECPYCGHIHDFGDPAFYNEQLTELDCDKCEKTFAVEVSHSTSWTCRALSEQETK